MGRGRTRLRLWAAVAGVVAPFIATGACSDGEDAAGEPKQTPDSGTPDQDAAVVDMGPFGDRAKVTETRALAGLGAPANAVRDEHGWVHIYARSLEDAVRVQGFMMAADRMGQMEMMRRIATGRLSELFGVLDPKSIDSDIAMRTVGLVRTAKGIYDGLGPSSEERHVLDAYAAGVTQWIHGYRNGKLAMPQELPGLSPDVVTDWTAVDTLAITRYQLLTLGYDANEDIRRSSLKAELTAKFNPGASDPLAQKRAGILVDVFRFDQAEPASPMSGFPTGGFPPDKIAPPVAAPKPGPVLPAAAFARVRGFADALERARGWLGPADSVGSNNWAVAGSKTASGHALLASDPHLALSSPAVWWPAHLVAQSQDGAPPEVEISGVNMGGIPGILVGTNRDVAFGPTTGFYDVTDVWKETLSADAAGVMFKSQKVAFQKVTETIKISGKPDYTWDVLVVPHHGPLIPEIKDHQVQPLSAGAPALSVRWTGHEPTREFSAGPGLWRAKTVADAEKALRNWETSAMNYALADSKGDVALTIHSKLPYRDKKAFTWDPKTFTGTLPCFVLDGASGDHEWTGKYLEEEYIPKVPYPAKGWVASANSDPIGSTDDNDPSNEVLPNGKPFFVGADYVSAARLVRIQERLSSVLGKATAEHMSEIQGDHQSFMGRRLAGYLISALEAAEQEKLSPGAHPDLGTVVAGARYAAADVPDLIDTLKKWGTDADYDAAAGLSLEDGSLDPDPVRALAAKATLIFNSWMIRAHTRTLLDELDAVQLGSGLATGRSTGYSYEWFHRLLASKPSDLATYDATTGESALWDDMTTPGEVETRNERLVTAALDGIDDIVTALGKDRSQWRWGALHRVRFTSLVPLWFVDQPDQTDPVFAKGFPRPSDRDSVDTANFPTWVMPSKLPEFSNSYGPTQRLVVELAPTGPKIRNVLPGGTVLDRESPYFANDGELWRRNQTHAVPFEIDDVEAAIPTDGQHVLFTP